MKKKRKLLWLVSAMLLFCMPLSVQAATGSSAKGAKLPSYAKVVTITVDQDNFSKSFYRALEEARTKANSKTQYKIIIPPGNYEATHTYRVPSNVYVYAKGAVIDRKATGKCVFMCDPNKSYSNIKIEGGVWDTTSQPANYAPDTALVRYAHVKNMIIQDATFKCKRGGHILEFSDMNGLTIKGCKISGNTIYRNVQPKEAIQLDVATKPAMVNCTPYNGKGCHNVIIENNQFTNVARGVGSHNDMKGVEKNPYTNVTVRNNTFKTLKGEGIFVMHWKNCTIEKNTIQNGMHVGIYVNSCSYNKIANNTIKKIKAFTGARKTQYGGTTAGVMIYQTTKTSITKNVLSQCSGKVVYDQGLCKSNSIKSNKKK